MDSIKLPPGSKSLIQTVRLHGLGCIIELGTIDDPAVIKIPIPIVRKPTGCEVLQRLYIEAIAARVSV